MGKSVGRGGGTSAFMKCTPQEGPILSLHWLQLPQLSVVQISDFEIQILQFCLTFNACLHSHAPIQAVTEAFERVDQDMEAWQLNTVPEEDEVGANLGRGRLWMASKALDGC